MNHKIGQKSIFEFFSYYKFEFITELELQQKNYKTIDIYQNVLDNFMEFIDIKSIEEIDHRVIIEFIRFFEKKSKNRKFAYWTNITYKKAVKLFINFIEDDTEEKLDIKWNKIKFKKEHKERKNFKEEDLFKIQSYLSNLYRRLSMIHDKSCLPEDLKSVDYIYTINIAFKLGLYLGLRADEICKLSLNDFSKEYIFNKKKFIDIKISGKGNKQRTLPISTKYICRELEYFTKNRDKNEILLKQIKGKNLTRHSLYNYLTEICKILDIENRGVHILRHTFAMNLRENGVDLSDAQDFLGHSDPSITRIYYKRSVNQMRRVAGNI